MTTVTGKGDPVVLSEATIDMRVVKLSIGNASRMGDDLGGMFLPDKLHCEWRNGKLIHVSVSGRVLRRDGNPWIDARRRSRIYLDGLLHLTLDPDTPDWVRELIKAHTP